MITIEIVHNASHPRYEIHLNGSYLPFSSTEYSGPGAGMINAYKTAVRLRSVAFQALTVAGHDVERIDAVRELVPAS